MGGLHSGETGPSEMLMELIYRLATETSPLIKQIRDNVDRLGHAGRGSGRPRSQRRLVLQGTRRTERAGAEVLRVQQAGGCCGCAGCWCRRPAARRRALPYWGKYVLHDNNRDINLSQVSMRALVDWYFTAHPPIMHDLHEAQPLMYTYSGGPPQNPNLDPILFTELPFFSNFELAQMTKWGMPGVYTHAFMDGWSPGYLGSVAYNHNGMMRMYETQSGRESGPGPGAAVLRVRSGRGVLARRVRRRRRPRRPTGRRHGRRSGGDCPPQRRRRRRRDAAGRRGGRGRRVRRAAAKARRRRGGRGGRGGVGGGGARRSPTGRGGGQPREWYRGLPIPPDAVANFSRRNNTNYMETGVLSGLQLTAMFPNLVVENFYRKTQNSIESGKKEAPYGYVIPAAAGHDESRDARQHPAHAAHRGRPGAPPRSRSATARSRPAPT